MPLGSTVELVLPPRTERALLQDLLDELHALEAATVVEVGDRRLCAAELSDQLRELLRRQD